MSVNRQTVGWLISTPASDLNFRATLDRATVEDIDEALLSPKLTKTARRLMESRKRSLARRLAPKKPRAAKAAIAPGRPHHDVAARVLGLGVLILSLALAAQLYAQR